MQTIHALHSVTCFFFHFLNWVWQHFVFVFCSLEILHTWSSFILFNIYFYMCICLVWRLNWIELMQCLSKLGIPNFHFLNILKISTKFFLFLFPSLSFSSHFFSESVFVFGNKGRWENTIYSTKCWYQFEVRWWQLKSSLLLVSLSISFYNYLLV